MPNVLEFFTIALFIYLVGSLECTYYKYKKFLNYALFGLSKTENYSNNLLALFVQVGHKKHF